MLDLILITLSSLLSGLRLKPSSAGIVKDFVGIGLGKFGTERPDCLKFPNKSAI